MPQLSPITNALEEELKRELRQRGIVVWLDKDGHYTAYVDELAKRYANGDFFAPVVAFRGSYLEMLLDLEPYGNGLDPEALLIHMPGHNEESVRKTPVLELYKAGFRFRKALDTLIREAGSGYIGPVEIETYLSSHPPNLADAEAWLQSALSQPKQGLVDYLESLTPEWVLDGLVGKEQVLRSRITQDADLADLTDYLYRQTGMDQPFLSFFLGSTPLSFPSLGQAFTGWLMCVEYANDLTRPPHMDVLKPLQTLAAPFRKTCDRLINHLRQQQADTYVTYADIAETHLQLELDEILPAETHLQLELDEILPEDLGQIDTFKREETRVLDGAVDALLAGDWPKALHWAQARIEKTCFWLQRDRARKLVWSLVQDAANLGQAIAQRDRPLKGITTLREALDSYTQSAYQVDRLHRRFEQQRLNLLEPSLPHFTQLLEVANHLRVQYRAWADQLAEDFAAICQAEGFLPEDDLQQRTLYDQVIHPLTQTKAKVAFFIIDAFRYEMAADLAAAFEGAGTTVTLKGRYAELPSITAVGMNALAPVSKAGQLILAGSSGFKGFKTGEYTVSKPDERVRAMGDRSLGNVSSGKSRVKALSLGDVCDRSTSRLKQSCGDASLIVVHSKELTMPEKPMSVWPPSRPISSKSKPPGAI
jgi:hypothetical protein